MNRFPGVGAARRRTALGLLTAGLSAVATPSMAGGLYLYEMGTSDLGFAAAGTAARAEDASTVYANPAGMTRLAGNQLTTGVQAMYGKANYKLDGRGSLTGGNPGNIIGWLPGGSAFYSHSINDDLKLGIGLYSNFGLAADFGKEWAGRNLVGKTALLAMTMQPTIAYRINEQWSLGAGLTANFGFFKLERERLLGGGGTASQQDGDWAFGARFGVMFEPTNMTRIGVVWGSKTEFDFDVDGRVTIGARTHVFPVGLGLSTPQQVMGSVYHRFNDRWAVMGNLGWQDWSIFSNSTVELNGTTSTSSLLLKDTWHAAIGGQYTLNENIKLNAGVAFDSSFYKSQSQTSFALPNGDTWRFGAGIQYALTPKSDLGVAVEYAHSQGSSSSSALVSGGYDKTELLFMSVNYTHRF